MASVEVERDARGRVIVATGDIDLNAAGRLEAALGDASGASSEVIVDLAGATMLDSRAIGVLLAWAEKLRPAGGRLVLAAASADVKRLFATIGLEREFTFVASVDEARPNSAGRVK